MPISLGREDYILPKNTRFVNRKIKEEFLEEMMETGTPPIETSVAAKTFVAVHKAEGIAGKDLYAFSSEEAERCFYNELRRMNPTVYAGWYMLDRYGSWCRRNGIYSGECGFVDRIPPGLEDYKKRKIPSPITVMNTLDRLEQICEHDDSRYGVRFRCCVWLGYFGLHWNKLDFITTDSIDLDNMRILYPDDEPYKMYFESVKDFRRLRKMDCGDGIYLLPDPQSYYARVIEWYERLVADSESRFYVSHDLSYKNVMLCGLFYRLFSYEMDGGHVNYNESTNEAVRDGLVNKNARSSEKTINDFFEAYSRWKLAFTPS